MRYPEDDLLPQEGIVTCVKKTRRQKSRMKKVAFDENSFLSSSLLRNDSYQFLLQSISLRQLTSAPSLVLPPIAQLNTIISGFTKIFVAVTNPHHPLLRLLAPLTTLTPHNTECKEHCRSYALFAYSLHFSGMIPTAPRPLVYSTCRPPSIP